MMYKRSVFVFLLVAVIFLSSCVAYAQNNPRRHPMSKWEAENLELYVFDHQKGMLIYKYQDAEYFYDVVFFAGETMEIFERFGATKEKMYSVESFALMPYKEDAFLLSAIQPNAPINFKVFPEKMWFKLVATDLTEDDIPEFETSEYIYCPKYFPGTQWISDDGKISMTIDDFWKDYPVVSTAIPIVKTDENGNTSETVDRIIQEVNVGVVGNTPETDDTIHAVFSNWGSMVYIGPMKVFDNSMMAPGFRLDIEKATDKWQCEYYEDGFRATVIESKYYEEGHTITFSKVNNHIS